MPRVLPFKPSGNAGEISPRLAARTDFSKYPNAVEIALNVIPLSEGGMMRRPGTRFVAELLSSSVHGRLYPFTFSTTQAYMTELCDQAIRFYRYQAQIIVADTDAAITNGTFPAGITSWSNRSTGGGSIAHDATNQRLSLVPGGTGGADIGWAEQAVTVGNSFKSNEHVVKFQVCGSPSDRVQLRIGSASLGTQIFNDGLYDVGYHCVAFTPGVTTFYLQFRNQGSFRNKTVQIDNVSIIDNTGVNVQTPYLEADLYQLGGPQSADVLYLFHGTYPTHKLERFGHTSWSLTQVDWQDGPWMEENATTTTLTFGAATGLGVTVTASSILGINNDAGFKTTDVGRLIRLTDEATVNWGWAIITGWTSTTVVTADVRRTVTSTAAEVRWRLGSWSGTTGYPSCGAFFEQRLIAADTTNEPETFWGSQTADFENQSPDSAETSTGHWIGSVQDDDAYDYTLSGDDVHAIRWLSPGADRLSIGTVSGEWLPSSTGAVLTPSDIAVRQQTNHGSAQIQPVRVNNVVLFVQKAKRKIREFGFDWQSNGYKAPDMTRLAEHVTRSGIVEIAYQEEPDSLVYFVRGDGTLGCMTYRREEDVVGMSRHILGGSFAGGQAVVESVAVIAGANGGGQIKTSENRNEVWLIVKRTINGSTKRYIEVMEGIFEGPIKEDYATADLWKTAMISAQASAYFSDCLITYSGSPATSISGLSYLEGQTVKVWADGAIRVDTAVASGAIAIDSASTVQIGLGYTHRIKGLKEDFGNPAGTAVGVTKKIDGITFVVLDTLAFLFGNSRTNLKPLDFRDVNDPVDSPTPLFTGEHFETFDGDFELDPRIYIESDAPAPFTLLATAPRLTVNPNP